MGNLITYKGVKVGQQVVVYGEVTLNNGELEMEKPEFMSKTKQSIIDLLKQKLWQCRI